MKFLVFFGCFAILSSLSGEDAWDGKEYVKHSQSQKESALDFLTGKEIKENERILDVGCGDGKVTAILAEKVPLGSVVGVDISPSMIAKSKSWEEKLKNLTFDVKDAASLEFDHEFDLITSFTVMHFVLEQSKALEGFARALKEGGRIWLQMPIGLPTALEKAVDEITHKKKWQGLFKDFSPPWRFYQLEEYRELLKTYFTPTRLEVVRKEEKFPSKEAFLGFLRAWFPYLRPLQEVSKGPFLSELLDAYLKILPLDEKGQVTFIVDRLEVEASLLDKNDKEIIAPEAVTIK